MTEHGDGVNIRRVVDHAGAHIPEHAHDWPVLCIHVLGGYLNRTELGERHIDGPSVVLYRRGAAHQNAIAARGFEQIEIEFDADWLGADLLPDAPCMRWIGSQATAARALCDSSTLAQPAHLRTALRAFLRSSQEREAPRRPDWLDVVHARVRENRATRIAALAAELGLHPSWLGAAFKNATGESILDYAARLRIEHAAHLLRESQTSLADIAIDAGFCDQSHMNRCFQHLLGRTPGAVRRDRAHFRRAEAPTRNSICHSHTPPNSAARAV